jgi:hypothetical protein
VRSSATCSDSLRSTPDGGWLIFALPSAELAAQPADDDRRDQLYLLCDNIEATVEELKPKGVEFTRPISDERWGQLTAFAIPAGSELALYEPRHPRPPLSRGPQGAHSARNARPRLLKLPVRPQMSRLTGFAARRAAGSGQAARVSGQTFRIGQRSHENCSPSPPYA